MTEQFEQKLKDFCQNHEKDLSELNEDSLSLLSKVFKEAFSFVGQHGIKTYLESFDKQKSHYTKNNSTYYYKGIYQTELLTAFGKTLIDRFAYCDTKNTGNYYIPLDEKIGIEKNDFATLDVRKTLLYASASCTPTELSELLKRCSLCKPSKTAIQNIINKDGERLEKLREPIDSSVIDDFSIPDETAVVVTSIDGANVLLREPGKKKGAKGFNPAHIQKGESPTSYKNAMVGTISFYTQKKELKEDKETIVAQRITSIHTARMPQERYPIFKEDIVNRFDRIFEKVEEVPHHVHHIFLCDAHPSIWGFAKETPSLKNALWLIDFYHTVEHLSSASVAMYGKNTDFSKGWFSKWKKELKENSNAPQAILRSMQGFLKRNKLSKERTKELQSQITFFKNNKKLMKYPEFISKGYPIGSGPVEAAAKTIVKQRMCKSGMRWNRQTGQHVLTIRAYVKSGLWDAVWDVYKNIRKIA